MEYTEVKMKSRMRDKKHPNMLVGTLDIGKTPSIVVGRKDFKFQYKRIHKKYRKNRVLQCLAIS